MEFDWTGSKITCSTLNNSNFQIFQSHYKSSAINCLRKDRIYLYDLLKVVSTIPGFQIYIVITRVTPELILTEIINFLYDRQNQIYLSFNFFKGLLEIL